TRSARGSRAVLSRSAYRVAAARCPPYSAGSAVARRCQGGRRLAPHYGTKKVHTHHYGARRIGSAARARFWHIGCPGRGRCPGRLVGATPAWLVEGGALQVHGDGRAALQLFAPGI